MGQGYGIVRVTRRWVVLAGLAAVMAAGLPGGAAAVAKEWPTIRIATEGAFPPYNFTKPDGTLAGFEIDFAHDLCRRMKATCEIVAQNWDGIMPGLTGGKYDAIMAAMAITPKRREVIDFTVPYISAPTRLATLKGGGLEGLPGTGDRFSLNDAAASGQAIDAMKARLTGKVLGVQVSTIQAGFRGDVSEGGGGGPELQDIGRDPARPDGGPGGCDVGVGGEHPGGDRQAGWGGYRVHGTGLWRGPLGIGSGIGIRKGDGALVALFDGAIKDAIADGTVARLSMQWFKLDLTPR